MLSLERVRELMAGTGLSDEELEELRVLAWQLAALAFDLRHGRQPPSDSATSPNQSNLYEEDHQTHHRP